MAKNSKNSSSSHRGKQKPQMNLEELVEHNKTRTQALKKILKLVENSVAESKNQLTDETN
ncbi:MAG TPA: hypothetical protein PK287_02015 [Tenuifilaceae bacterium]|jgi:uncharacterized protein YprB with RNaseH-like and TPR domain|nr:hypothetical protein [Tenuifilaceae bacterium]HPK76433.1 hypothetical protein [Tenuifilaceae bacterium]